MEYSWIPDCPNTCGGHINTECKDMDIGCMCADEKYILTSVCCLSKTCGNFSISYAKMYIESYCKDWKVTPPNITNLDCAKAASSSLIATTATSTAGTSSATSTSQQSGDSASDRKEAGPNVGMIAGVAGGIGFLVLALIGAAIFFYCRRKKEAEERREAAAKASQAKEDFSPSNTHSSTLEALHMSELAQTHTSPYGQNQVASEAWQHGYPGVSPYNASCENMQPVPPSSPLNNGGYWSELGSDGARPHGSELAGRPMLPPRPELQGMSFITRNPYPSELAPSEPTYQR
ncbi:unnamed protein product [Clonostachys rosea]|uniref:CFEM domain-containing protein n=1 Tax=Bionectria ochroleuca TaxID=29856 RepID=A0ABY6UHR4_BIOOC|nr:unnamed protein product [Clonostachys rosea]